MSLRDYGWDDDFARCFAAHGELGLLPGRVVLEGRGSCTLRWEGGEVAAAVAGRLGHQAGSAGELPAVGDWVAWRQVGAAARVEQVLPRRTCVVRKVAGTSSREQVVAANVDRLFLVMGLDGDYNLRRLERLLVMAWESGARPVVVLSKADLEPAWEECVRRAQEVAPGVAVHALSAVAASGLEQLGPHLAPGTTVALVGSSGAGKSTLLNRLAGAELLRTGPVRGGDDRGRHTTTHRELVRLPGGGLIIDNPGLREIQLASGETGIEATFDDVARLAERCRFADCGHTVEPGCAVRQAVADGGLAAARLASLRSLERELAYQERRVEGSARQREKARWREIHRAQKKHRPRQL